MQDKHAFRIPEKCFSMGTRTQSDGYTKLQEKGLYLTSHGKVAVILVLEECDEHGKSSDHDTMEENEKINAQLVEELSNDNQQFVKVDILFYAGLRRKFGILYCSLTCSSVCGSCLIKMRIY